MSKHYSDLDLPTEEKRLLLTLLELESCSITGEEAFKSIRNQILDAHCAGFHNSPEEGKRPALERVLDWLSIAR